MSKLLLQLCDGGYPEITEETSKSLAIDLQRQGIISSQADFELHFRHAYAQRLLSHGADPNAVDPNNGETPLIKACVNGLHKVVSLLLENKAKVKRCADRLKDDKLVKPDRKGTLCLTEKGETEVKRLRSNLR